jgi:hypothetical protein
MMQLIDVLIPAFRPTIKEMRRGGAFLAQSISHPTEIIISTRGIPRMILHLNQNRDERYPFIKQSIYSCSWGQRATSRGYVFRWVNDKQMNALKIGLPDAKWVVVT